MAIVLYIVTILFASGVGWSFREKYTAKKRFYSDLVRTVNEISIRMRYTRPRIEDIIAECGKNAGNELKETLASYMCAVNFSALPKGGYCVPDGLDEEEKAEVNNFFNGLGKSDVDGQIAHISLFAERFAVRYRDAEEFAKVKGGMCVKLGFLCGIALCIALI